MNTINNHRVSFGSTIIHTKTAKALTDYYHALGNGEIESIQGKSVEDAYKKLFKLANNDKRITGVMLHKTEPHNYCMRFLGFSIENDSFIYRMLKKIDPNAKYVKDVPDDGFEHGPISLLI